MASQDWFDKDFYAVLGVSKDVSDAELKKTYRKLARQFHPDSNPGDAKAEARFKEISEAYSVLSDPEQRAEYDQIRAMGSGARFTPGGGGSAASRTSSAACSAGRRRAAARELQRGRLRRPPRRHVRRRRASARPPAGTAASAARPRAPTSPRPRPSTSAPRSTATRSPCSCRAAASTKVKIPAGVADGQKIKLKGKGQPSPDGGAAGDLVLTVDRAPASGLRARRAQPARRRAGHLRRGRARRDDRGADPRRRRRCKLRVAPGTPSGRVLRVKGRGVVTAKGTGDLLATVQVAVPGHLPGDAKKELEAFAAAMPDENPRADLLEQARG